MKFRFTSGLAVALLAIACLAAVGETKADSRATSPKSVLAVMEKVADWQIPAFKGEAKIDWQHGACYAGMMALSRISQNRKYADAMTSIGEKNGWKLGPRPYHADDHCVGQTYIELYETRKDPKIIAPTRTSMDELVKHLSSEQKLTWDWCDALFMAPPTLARLSAVTKDRKYVDAMDREWWKTTDALYDKKEHLYYRDARFLDRKTKNGKPVFWGRGNGWVLAGTARVLQYMPKDYPTRPRYVQLFKDMSAKVLTLQGVDGMWRPSLLDPDEVPIGETSSTGFFCYGLAWGINNGLLDSKTYRPAVEKAWDGLVSKVHPDGFLGFVQPVGDRPAETGPNTTDTFGVGAFLLAGSEVYKLPAAKPAKKSETSPGGMDKVVRQLKTFYTPSFTRDAEKFAATLREDGSWADIDYKMGQRSSWPASTHSARIQAMASAMNRPDASPELQTKLEKAVHSALGYWMANDFQCPNWWFNKIDTPHKLGVTGVMLGDRLTPEERTYITSTVMPRAKIDMTGQNRVWLAGNTLMCGLIERDEEKIGRAASTIFGEVVVTTKEGIQPDFSFHQHGPQQQFGNYGAAFAGDEAKWLAILKGTPWAMPEDKVEILRSYLLEGQNWVTWRGAMDISSCGRQLSPGSPVSKASWMAGLMKRMSGLDPTHSKQYLAFVNRNQPGGKNDLVGSKYFWRSDYLVDRRSDLCYTVKMCSNRVIGSESLNGENLSGYHLADGATYIYRTGDEYKDIFPLWDWRKLPGVTCAYPEGPVPSFSNYRLAADFVGGVADGSSACAVLDYQRDGVSTRKAWFFSGDRMVCLGSGISSTGTAPVATTINQCLLRGEVTVNDGTTTTLSQGDHSFDNLKWVEHDGLRYLLLQPQKVSISNLERTGNWDKVFKKSGMPSQDVKGQVFQISIEHGSKPANGTYAYAVEPASARPADAFKVLSNTPDVQAVSSGDKVIGVIFYTAGGLDTPAGRLTVDSPCVVLIDHSGRTPKVTVSDPTQKLKPVVHLDGKAY